MDIKKAIEPDMTPEEFKLFKDYIHEKSGIHFAENKMYLVKNRLIKRMNELGIKDYRDYFYSIKYDNTMNEFNNLMNLMTTNETSFFRNEPQLKSFSDEVIPKLIGEKQQARAPKTIKIWSAGCSTGEEPYTLGIILKEKMLAYPDWKIEIVANDISEQVLKAARRGIYNNLTLRNVKPEQLQRYFTKVNESYQINTEIKAMVNFNHLNLNDSRLMASQFGYDIIFCRNVMIYFSEEVKKQLVRNFYNSLNAGGYLYIGHSESLHGISKAFKLVYFKNALVYNKENTGTTTDRKPAFSATLLTKKEESPAARANRALDLLSNIKK